MDLLNNRAGLLTEGDVRTKIFDFMIPVLLGQLMQQLYLIADAVIVGRFLNQQALASVVSTSCIIFLVTGISIALASVCEAVITTRINEKRTGEISAAVHTSVIYGLIVGLTISFAGVILAGPLLRMMRVPFDIIEDATGYLRIYFVGYAAVAMYHVLTGVIHAASDSKNPLYYLCASCVLNIVLDCVFVIVLKMGVRGAAFATVISQLFSMILVLKDLIKATDETKLTFSGLRSTPEISAEIRSLALPVVGQDMLFDFPAVIVQIYINTFGSAAIAGIGAAVRTEELIFLFTDVFSIAAAAFISQNILAGKYERARMGMSFTMVAAILFIQCAGVLAFFLAPGIIALFNGDPDVIQFGTERLKAASLFYFLVGFGHVSSAVMRATGRAKEAMLTMFFSWFVTRIIILVTLGSVLHQIEIAYWIYPMTWMLSSAVYAYFMLNTEIGPEKKKYQ